MVKKIENLEDDEHVKHRSDTYMGSKNISPLDYYVFDPDSKAIEKRTIITSPGLIHIFLEILSNASDNILGAIKDNFPLPTAITEGKRSTVPLIEVSFNRKNHSISILNYGEPLQVRYNDKFKDMLDPEVAFGKLRSSSNYDDNQIRLGVGRNGFGAKITNIFSEFFEVEINDAINGQFLTLRWEDGMKKLVSKEVVPGFDPATKKSLGTKGKRSDYSKSYVKVTFKPNLSDFKAAEKENTLKYLSDDIVNVIRRIVFDIGFSTRIPISFDKKVFHFKTLNDFLPYYFPNDFGVVVTPSVKQHQEEGEGEEEGGQEAEVSTSFPIIYYYSELTEKGTGTSSSLIKTFKTVKGKMIEDKLKPAHIKLSSFKDIKTSVEVFITKNSDTTNEKNSISFVNGLLVEQGKHIDEIINKTFIPKIISSLPKTIQKKDTKIKPADIKKYFTFIINVFIPNPTFGGQTKNELTGPELKIDNLDDDDFKNILKKKAWKDLLDEIRDKLAEKDDEKLTKTDANSKRRAIHVKDASEANYAGVQKYVKDCVLWLTEGASAKKYVDNRIANMPGGKDFNGVYGVRGKFVNVTKAANSKLSDNSEYKDIKALLNLSEKDTFKSDDDITKKLKYGKIMIATDSDEDGIHIRMLLLNLFAEKWPDLIKLGKIAYISTPAVRVIKGATGSTATTVYRFYSDKKYDEWARLHPDEVKKYYIKHYKGLATSSNENIKEDIYTAPLVTILYDKNAMKSLNLAFGTKEADQRKEWIKDWKKNFDEGKGDVILELEDISNTAASHFTTLNKKGFDISSFYDKYLIKERPASNIIENDLAGFSFYTLFRAIPSVYDGLKRSQRQILWYCLNHWNYTDKGTGPSEKVPGLAGAIVKAVNYAHGQVSLEDAIVNMAHFYPGTNNVNLLYPDGQFGTREDDKKTAPRYISTKLAEVVPYIFKKEFTAIVPQREVEGKDVETEWIPCDIPLHLINGAEGISTGWRTFIPSYNPAEIVDWYINYLTKSKKDKRTPTIDESKVYTPFYKGFNGEIEVDGDTLLIKGKYKVISTKGVTQDIHIFDIPIGEYAVEYENYLKGLIEKKRLKNYLNKSKGNQPEFILEGFIPKGGESANPTDLLNNTNLNLIKRHSLNSFVLIDNDGAPQRFSSIESIMKIHIKAMITIYKKYKENTLAEYAAYIAKLTDKMKLIIAIVEEKLIVNKRPEADIIADIQKQRLSEEEYHKLKVREMNKEEIEKLKKEIEKTNNEAAALEKIDHRDLYKDRLEAFRKKFLL